MIVGSLGMIVTLGTMAAIFGTAPLDATSNPTLSGIAGIVA